MYFRKDFMKTFIFIFTGFVFVACSKPQAYPPVGGVLSKNDLAVSKDRSKHLNEMERDQIKDWISGQSQKFYPMQLNYWVNVPDLSKHIKKKDGVEVSYQYELYDFDMKKFYDEPTIIKNATLGKFVEIKAVEDAVRYMDKGQEVTLLIPSVLAYGTYGDSKEIPNDMPLIVKLKML